jgi:hypothetical protein
MILRGKEVLLRYAFDNEKLLDEFLEVMNLQTLL